MTETELQKPATPRPATASWDSAFAELKARFPKVREPIVVALHILMQNPDIALDDAKARANLHGVRITAASIAAAQRILAKQEPVPAAPTPAVAPAPKPAPRQPRRERTAEATDPAAMIQQVVTRLQQQSGAEAQRLRDAIRRAVAVLQAAVGS